MRILIFLVIGLVLFVAGCGGDEPATTQEPATTAEPVTEQTPEAPATEGGTTTADAGEERFVSTCGACHTLSDAGTNGQVGPNLDQVAPDVEQVLTAIETGPEVMPENLLEGEEARQVAEYVAANAGG